MKTKDVEKIIQNYIKKEESYISEHEEIANILRPLQGKPISGKVLNKKVLGEKFKLTYQYGMYNIVGNESHLIGYDSESFIFVEKSDISRGFEYFDCCQGSAAKERINQLRKIDVNMIVKIFGKIEKNFNEIRVLFSDIENTKLGSFNNPIYYELLNHIFDEKSVSGYCKIKLSDFYFIRKPK